MSEEKLGNTSQPPISQLLQDIKKKRDAAYQAKLKQKEQQIWNEQLATERKIKQLLEQDQEEFYTDMERRFDDFIGTEQRTQTRANSDFPWGMGYSNSSKLNLQSTTDFPPLNGRK